MNALVAAKRSQTIVRCICVCVALGLLGAGCSKSKSTDGEEYLKQLRNMKGKTIPKHGPSKTKAETAEARSTPAPAAPDAEKVLKQYLADLTNENSIKRTVARSEIIRAGKAAAPGLVKYVRESASPSAREVGIALLFELADEPSRSDIESIYKEMGRELQPQSRCILIQLLDRFGGKEYTEMFRKDYVKERDREVQSVLAVALARAGDSTGVESFMRMLEAGGAQQKEWAVNRLKELYGQDFGADVAAWREWIAKERAKAAQGP